jgi:8-oxo-dGTP pyrophosphatase MutT (NUDIX family)
VKRSGKDKNADQPVQYAALPYRVDTAGGLEVMLITSRGTGRWVIPKGWPMKGRSPPKAAEREAMEEAGIAGVVSKMPIGHYHYVKLQAGARDQLCTVHVFPLRVRREKVTWLERDQRQRQWFAPAVAATLVDEPELQDLIRRLADDLVPGDGGSQGR